MAKTEVLIKEFDDLGFDLGDPKVVNRLVALCDIYGLSEDRMSCQYLAFTTSSKLPPGTSPTLEIIQKFEKKLETSLNTKPSVHNVETVSKLMEVDREDGELDEEMTDLMAAYGSTPKNLAKKRAKDPTPEDRSHKKLLNEEGDAVFSSHPASNSSVSSPQTASARKYGDRTNAASVVIKFGGDLRLLSSIKWKYDPNPVLIKRIGKEEEILTEPYRYMFERLRDKAGILDEIICHLGDVLISQHELEELVDFTKPHPHPVVVLGRVCCDSAEGKINAQSILFQGNQDLVDGRTVRFDPGHVQEYSLFPGQIIAAIATNPDGTNLIANKIYSDASVNDPKLKKVKQLADLGIMICSGPYTTSNNLDYEPFVDLLKYIRANRPHVVILIGPFVDAKHPIIESCLCPDFETIFAQTIMKSLVELLKELTEIQLIMLPSAARDVHHDYIYPTPPFEPSRILKDRIHMMSDPCLVSVDGINFGITSTDILFHLGKEEISFPPRNGDRLRRLANHLFQQRSFYPLYPPSEELNVDYEKFEMYAGLNIKPDVLILPSDLLHFFKDVEGVVVINPQRLAKGSGGGAFARLHIAKGDSPLLQRLAAEIVRI